MPIKSSDSSNWFLQPARGHLVQFYPRDSALLNNLTEYVAAGLENNETCVVIATPKHITKLNARLGRQLEDGTKRKNFLTFDAAQLLKSFMVNGLPEKTKFYETVGGLLQQLSQLGKPIRAYGEMVALLWKAGNENAVVELEALWNELSKKNNFSLYCAYPDLHFLYDSHSKQHITHLHNVNVSSLKLHAV